MFLNSFESFKELTLPGPLLKGLLKMGFETPTPVQKETIPVALDGKDVIGTAETGTGKTGAFGIPTLSFLYSNPDRQALILVPTRELAAQVYQVFRKMTALTDMRGTLMVGGEPFGKQAREFREGVDYIIATPGRLIDHLQEKTVSLSRIRVLVFDEVDRMLDMGFRPQIRQLMKYVPADRQTLFFSATLPDEVKELTAVFLKDPVRISVGSMSKPIAQVAEETIRTSPEGKITIIKREVRTREGKILVFTRTKHGAERVARILHEDGQPVVCLHGDRTQGQRKEALMKFRKGSHRIMVATDLAGRGIDISDIEHVINFDVPSTREDYIHRLGRTARNGKTGSALTLLISGDYEGERIVNGEKAPPKFAFRSRRRFR